MPFPATAGALADGTAAAAGPDGGLNLLAGADASAAYGAAFPDRAAAMLASTRPLTKPALLGGGAAGALVAWLSCGGGFRCNPTNGRFGSGPEAEAEPDASDVDSACRFMGLFTSFSLSRD